MRLSSALIACCAMALASPAMAQAHTSFAPLSPLDAAIFDHPTSARIYTMSVTKDGWDFGKPKAFSFRPIYETHPSKSFLANLRDVRRYGGEVSVPVSLFGANYLLEGEGSRDFGPNVQHMDIGRLRLAKDLGGNVRAGLEFSLYRGDPADLRIPHDHRSRDFVAGFSWRKLIN